MGQKQLSTKVIVLCVVMIVCAAALVVTVQVLSHSKPSVEQRFSVYLEKLTPNPMVVVATTQQRYTASKEFTAKLLAIFNLHAKIRLTAVADVTYVVPASDPSAWSVTWDEKTRTLRVIAPAPDCLLPAIHTDTIEIYTENSNMLTNMMFQLKEEAARMNAELSNDMLARAKATLSEPEVRSSIEEGLRKFAEGFCESARLGKPRAIEIKME
jgi:hypothetical protein